jgi:hypothetical protein
MALLPTASGAQHPHVAAVAASGVPARIYNVTVTSQTKTTWVDGGCGQYCVRYDGTVKRTETYRGLRVTSSEFRDIVQLQGSRKGTFKTRWSHGSNPPACTETLEQTGPATIGLYGRYGVKGNRLMPALMTFGVGPAGPPRGATITCAVNTNPVPVAGRLGTTIVGGTLTETTLTLNRIAIGRRANGAPGAPLDQITRGAGFAITLRGTTKDSAAMKEQLAAGKQATYTEGSARIVFTPVARKAQRRVPADAGAAPRSLAATRTRGATCAKTYPGWWSTTTRACFRVTASARWQLRQSWTQDSSGAPCVGAETTTVSWKSTPGTFWVGDTFPAGYTGTSRTRTSNFLQGPLKAIVTMQATGGAHSFGCIPILRSGCGTRTVLFRDAFPAYSVLMVEPVTLALSFETYATPASPFHSCGVTGSMDLSPSPPFGAWVVERRPWSRGISGLLDDLAERRLLATPVGGRVTFRASGQPVDDASFKSVTGYLNGAVTFERVR